MRLKSGWNIDIDAIMESAYVEQLIEDNGGRPSYGTETERPDTVAASLIEGRVAIIVDNTPLSFWCRQISICLWYLLMMPTLWDRQHLRALLRLEPILSPCCCRNIYCPDVIPSEITTGLALSLRQPGRLCLSCLYGSVSDGAQPGTVA